MHRHQHQHQPELDKSKMALTVKPHHWIRKVLYIPSPSAITALQTQTRTMVAVHEDQEEEERLLDQDASFLRERGEETLFSSFTRGNMALDDSNATTNDEPGQADNEEMQGHSVDEDTTEPNHPSTREELQQLHVEVQPHRQDHLYLLEQAQPSRRRRNEQNQEDPSVIDLQNDRADLLVQAQERHGSELSFLSAPNSLYAMLHRAEVHGTTTPPRPLPPPPPPAQQQPRELQRENMPRPTIETILGQAMEILRNHDY